MGLMAILGFGYAIASIVLLFGVYKVICEHMYIINTDILCQYSNYFLIACS